jgi:hypothetical protein
MEPIDRLFQAIQTRPRPEDVAEIILEIRGEAMDAHERDLLDRAARHSLKRAWHGYSSMRDDFARVAGADKLVATSSRLFALPEPPAAEQCADPAVITAFAERLAATVALAFEGAGFSPPRRSKEEREAAGVKLPKRDHNRRVRALLRFSRRLTTIARNNEKYFATRVAKSAGATLVSRDDLTDLDTACFVAYLSARMSLRSTFTNTSQVRAFDQIAEMLLRRAMAGKPDWYAVALVHPEVAVLSRLYDADRGRLLGVWTEALRRTAALLATLASENDLDLETMVVTPGNDSSSWNAAAGAWNKARAGWISIVYALGLDRTLDVFCPGKVMRLMAADVAAWHAATKGEDALDPNTKVWAELPAPWLVFQGKADCPRGLVEEACARHGVDLKGWVTPPPKKRAAAFAPTPELVHGVAVSSPFLAEKMRALGWFSDRAAPNAGIIDGNVEVLRDDDGFAMGVHEITVDADPSGELN